MTKLERSLIDKTIVKLQEEYYNKENHQWVVQDCPICMYYQENTSRCSDCILSTEDGDCGDNAVAFGLLKTKTDMMFEFKTYSTSNKDIPLLIEFLICMKEQL